MKICLNESIMIAITIYISISIEFEIFKATNSKQKQSKRKRIFDMFEKVLQSRSLKNHNQDDLFMKNSNVDVVFKAFDVVVKSRRVFAKEKSERLFYQKNLFMIECLKCNR